MIGVLRRRHSGLRDRLLAVVLLATVLALIATIAGFNVLLASRLDATADDLLRTQVNTELAEIDVQHGPAHRARLPARGRGDRRAGLDLRRTTADRAAAQPADARPRGARPGGRPAAHASTSPAGRYACSPCRSARAAARSARSSPAVSMTPYRRTRELGARHLARRRGRAAGAASLVATRWVLAAGLRPVARMTAQAAEWSEHDLDRRFDLGPPHDELTQLAATLDGLLGRARRGPAPRAALLGRALTRAAHAADADARARRSSRCADERCPTRPARRVGGACCARATRWPSTLDALLAGARAEARPRPGIADAAPRRRGGRPTRFRPLAAERGVRIAVDAASTAGSASGVDPELLERILAAAASTTPAATPRARCTIAVAARERPRSSTRSRTTAPASRDDERERIFEPAVRGSAGTALREGTGLGLALARRLARAAGGSVEALERDDGACFAVRVPPA